MRRRNQQRTLTPRVAIVIALAAMFGCSPTMAPPVYSTHNGTPTRVRGHAIGIGGAGNLWGSGGGRVGVPVSPSTDMEVGGDFRLVDAEQWAMANAGLRYAFLCGEPIGFAIDLELGAGIGRGGIDRRSTGTDASEPSPWHGRLAYGGYFGIGVGYHFLRWLSLFVRGRAQLTEADEIPATLWGSAIAGPQISFGAAALYVAVGIAGYRNSVDDQLGYLPEVGLTLRL